MIREAWVMHLQAILDESGPAGALRSRRWRRPSSLCRQNVGGYDNSYASAVGSAMDMAIRRNEITMACMRQKGWQPASSSYTPQEKFTPTKVDLPS